MLETENEGETTRLSLRNKKMPPSALSEISLSLFAYLLVRRLDDSGDNFLNSG
jgi:hypothetical protein